VAQVPGMPEHSLWSQQQLVFVVGLSVVCVGTQLFAVQSFGHTIIDLSVFFLARLINL
jgi:hypothetical protein